MPENQVEVLQGKYCGRRTTGTKKGFSAGTLSSEISSIVIITGMSTVMTDTRVRK